MQVRGEMARSLTSKLESQRGASMPLALLLFLICAALAAVVLSAGTIASGRFAGLAASDQRYYSVTSAAQVFKSELKSLAENDKKVDVICTCETTGPSSTYTTKIGGEDDPSSILGLAAAEMFTTSNDGFAWDWKPGVGFSLPEGKPKDIDTWTMEFETSKVEVKETLKPDGTLVFTFGNDIGNAAETAKNSQYKIWLTCTPRVEQVYEAAVVSGTKTTQKKTLRISWENAEITTTNPLPSEDGE